MREAGIESETHAMGGGHEKGAIFSAPILPRFPPSRVSRAPRLFVLNSCEKKRPFCRLLTSFSKSVDKIL